MQIKNIYFFFSTLKIKGLGDANIKKLYFAEFNSVEKILKASKKDLMIVENFGEKTVDNIIIAIKESLSNVSLAKLMAASNKLGHGLGEERMKQILYNYPNIIIDYKKWSKIEFIKKIKIIDGWEDKTSTLFVNNFHKFIKFYNLIKKYITLENKDEKINGFFTNKIIVLTGFRDKDLQSKLEKQGAKINSTISKNTDYLIIKDNISLNNQSDKIKKAKDLNITILTKEELINLN
jgi:DNA ligase (NAD+)